MREGEGEGSVARVLSTATVDTCARGRIFGLRQDTSATTFADGDRITQEIGFDLGTPSSGTRSFHVEDNVEALGTRVEFLGVEQGLRKRERDEGHRQAACRAGIRIDERALTAPLGLGLDGWVDTEIHRLFTRRTFWEEAWILGQRKVRWVCKEVGDLVDRNEVALRHQT